MVGKLGKSKVGRVIGGIENEMDGKSIPKSNENDKSMVGKLGRSNVGKVMGGMEKLILGRSIPRSNEKDRSIVGKLGRSRLGSVIGGIENDGKSQRPIYTYYCKDCPKTSDSFKLF